MSKGTLLVRADASAAIGTGHVMRCIALAQAWQDAGGRVAFAMVEATPAVEERLRNEGAEVIYSQVPVGGQEDSTWTSGLALTHQAEWVVVDGYQFGGEYQSALKKAGHKVLFVDDNGDAGRYAADLVLNQNAYASEALYRNRDSGTELLLGLEYAMLRREFTPWRDRQRDNSEVGGKVLVTSGGSDAANMTLGVIQALELVGAATLEAVIVVGGSGPHTSQIEGAVARSGLGLSLRQNVTSMPELMAWADVAVSAAGTTVLELAFMGVPAVLVTVAENQKANAQACERLGMAVNLGDFASVAPAQLAAVLRKLIVDSERRKKMTQSAHALVDGRGAERVAKRLISGSRRTCNE